MSQHRSHAVVVFICCLSIVSLAFGVRQSFGLFMRPITLDTGWARESLALTFATQAFTIGLLGPVAGAFADRWNPGKVLMLGGGLFCVGLLTMAGASRPSVMFGGGGLLVGAGLSGCGLPLALAVVGRIAPADRRSLWLGVATASATLGQLVLVPLIQTVIVEYGWRVAVLLGSGLGAFIVPLATVVARSTHAGLGRDADQSLGETLRGARSHPGYILLTLGFFVCGFQVQFITIHLPAYIVDQGLASSLAASALMVIAAANALGSWIAGWAGGFCRKRYLLSGIYGGRALLFLVLISVPLSPPVMLVLSAGIGLLWLGTVPLTSGLVAEMFGPRYMATLYSFVFLNHQLGSFMGVWLGGRIYDATGSYELVWWLTIALGAAASLIHLPIDDRPMARLVTNRG
ncbi:MAG: MFS transporter [Acidobacteria bacterium]|nr:MFS transporter [Acidobacteriota bacterium]